MRDLKKRQNMNVVRCYHISWPVSALCGAQGNHFPQLRENPIAFCTHAIRSAKKQLKVGGSLFSFVEHIAHIIHVVHLVFVETSFMVSCQEQQQHQQQQQQQQQTTSAPQSSRASCGQHPKCAGWRFIGGSVRSHWRPGCFPCETAYSCEL